MGEAGGRRRSPLPAPRPAPASRADQVPAPAVRPPGLALAAPPACQDRARGAGARTAAAGTGRVLGARPERAPTLRLACAQGTATDPAPAPSAPRDAPLRPDVGGCGGPAAERGRRRAGKRFLPFPGAQGSFCGRFYLRSQTKLAAAFPRSAPPRVKRSGRRPAGSQPVGQEPSNEGRTQESRDPGRGEEHTSSYSLPQPTAPRSLLHPLGCVSQKAPGPPRTWGQGHSTLVTTARATCHPQAPQPGPSSRQSKVFGFCPVRSRYFKVSAGRIWGPGSKGSTLVRLRPIWPHRRPGLDLQGRSFLLFSIHSTDLHQAPPPPRPAGPRG